MKTANKLPKVSVPKERKMLKIFCPFIPSVRRNYCINLYCNVGGDVPHFKRFGRDLGVGLLISPESPARLHSTCEGVPSSLPEVAIAVSQNPSEIRTQMAETVR
ncbi:MAG: hypothetical protein ACP5D7_13230 [Limnospira sp.]